MREKELIINRIKAVAKSKEYKENINLTLLEEV